MDEFGLLTARYGLKPQGKSAPMASLKQHHSTTKLSATSSFEDSSLNSKSANNLDSLNGSLSNGNDTLFGSSKNQNSGVDFDVFGGFQPTSNPARNSSNGSSSFDYDSIFSNSSSSRTKPSPGLDDDDIFGSFSSKSKRSVEIDDLLGGTSNGGNKSWNESSSGDDLMSGFGSSSVSGNGQYIGTNKSAFMSTGDPFDVFGSTSSTATKPVCADPLEEMAMFSQSRNAKPAISSNISSPILKPPPKAGQVLKSERGNSLPFKHEGQVYIVIFFVYLKGYLVYALSDARQAKAREGSSGSKYKEAEDARRENAQNNYDHLDSFFAASSPSSSVPKSRSTTTESVYNGKTKPEVAQRKSSHSSTVSVKKPTPEINLMGDFSSIFGDVSSFGEFEEIEGESEERRRARLQRYQRTNERVARAVADMNQRDFQTMQEHEERSRIAETMDAEIKRWVAGKEGNMRALLSSLQYVLWPECGWELVSLTDLITSTSVKKVYRKATLCVHPDKVQQKGATLQQKYMAEKVFDILKEAWTKFSKEELK